jgi:hypothetical protein
MDPADLDGFVGTEDQPGEYRIGLVLLGILIGYPGQAAVLIERLQGAEDSKSWWELVEELRTLAETDRPSWAKWERILAWLDELHRDDELRLPDQISPYRNWALSA